jgi:hypothetical protein
VVVCDALWSALLVTSGEFDAPLACAIDELTLGTSIGKGQPHRQSCPSAAVARCETPHQASQRAKPIHVRPLSKAIVQWRKRSDGLANVRAVHKSTPTCENLPDRAVRCALTGGRRVHRNQKAL